MNTQPPVQTVLFRTRLEQHEDVLRCRECADRLTQVFGLAGVEAIRWNSSVSEATNSACEELTEAEVEFIAVQAAGTPPGRVNHLRVMVTGKAADFARFKANLQAIPFLGEASSGRDNFVCQVNEVEGSASVLLQIHLQASESRVWIELGELARELEHLAPETATVALRKRNLEVLRVLEELEREREHVSRINTELADTNRGVVALYDELDTLYRVSNVVAAQLDLQSLLQAIIDATTDICAAEFGAFFYREPGDERYKVWATAGPMRDILQRFTVAGEEDLFGGRVSEDVILVSDLHAEEHPFLKDNVLPIRSYLAVPVRDHTELLAGGLIFGHLEPGRFSERTERIMTGIAAQAAVGLENARLYNAAKMANAAKDQFLAMLSHELRTPLNPVITILTEIQEEPDLSDRVRRHLHAVQRNVALEARLIDDLLDITRIVRGKAVLHFEPTDVHNLIAEVCDICRADLEDGDLRVESRLLATRHTVNADTARLQQVLWNLLKNAIKFTPPGGVITIQTKDIGDRICVEVTDTGRGISKDILPHIFKPFEQGDARTTAQYGGLGLGLTIAKRVMDAHGGEILAESDGPEHGATFIIRMHTMANPAGGKPAMPGADHLPAGGSWEARLLVVDDHEDTVNSLKRLLERRGFKVVTACDCKEALAVAAETPLDLVISDLGLPDGSGIELMQELRTRHALPGIALSGFGMEADVERSLASGFSAHITKPVNFALLMETIATVLGPGAK